MYMYLFAYWAICFEILAYNLARTNHKFAWDDVFFMPILCGIVVPVFTIADIYDQLTNKGTC